MPACMDAEMGGRGTSATYDNSVPAENTEKNWPKKSNCDSRETNQGWNVGLLVRVRKLTSKRN